MTKLIIRTFVTAALLMLLPAAAGASCIQETRADQANRAVLVAFGKVAKADRGAGTYYVVNLERIYKGTASNLITIYSASGATSMTSVDYNMQEGEEHTLYLMQGEKANTYATNACSGSHPGKPTAEELQVLGEGQPASPASEAAPEPTAFRRMIPIIATAVGIGAVLVVALVPRFLRRRDS